MDIFVNHNVDDPGFVCCLSITSLSGRYFLPLHCLIGAYRHIYMCSVSQMFLWQMGLSPADRTRSQAVARNG